MGRLAAGGLISISRLGLIRHDASTRMGLSMADDNILRSYRVPKEVLEEVLERETRELVEREALYRRGQPPLEIDGRTVILVDDGLATGATMRAAVHAVKGRARRVIVAVPVGAQPT